MATLFSENKSNPVNAIFDRGQSDDLYYTEFGQYFYTHEEVLPALEFFSLQNVSPENRKKFFKLLGEMFELYITPHTLSANNTGKEYSCSFLKLFEQRLLRDTNYFYEELLFHILNILEIESNDIYVKTVNLFSSPLQLRLPKDFKDLLNLWQANLLFKSKLILNIRFFTHEIRRPAFENPHLVHHVFLALVKNEEQDLVELTFIDPLGTSESYLVNNFIRALTWYLQTTYSLTVKNMMPHSEKQQLLETGSSSEAWHLYNFVAFLRWPNLKFYMAARNEMLNFYIFSLAMFIRTMPKVGLSTYLSVSADLQGNYPVAFYRKCELETRETYEILNARVKGPNCFFKSLGKCTPASNCIRVNVDGVEKCDKLVAVKKISGQKAQRLSPKNIAKKILLIYMRLRKYAGRDERGMTSTDVSKQLEFKEEL